MCRVARLVASGPFLCDAMFDFDELEVKFEERDTKNKAFRVFQTCWVESYSRP